MTKVTKTILLWAILLTLLCFLPSSFSAEVYFLENEKIIAFDAENTRAVRSMSQNGMPSGERRYLFDWKKATESTETYFLVSKGANSASSRLGSDAPIGYDLWLLDDAGAQRQIAESVYRAKFSPDSRSIVYTTSDCVMRVEYLAGRKTLEVRGAYDPSWTPDGKSVVFSKVPASKDNHYPETLHLAIINLNSGWVDLITDDRFDDCRPECHPSGNWILFVSGGRSGVASFWKVPIAGGQPVQITNIGLKVVDDSFVPTPYQKTVWSADGRWFIYDFKKGNIQQIWGLEFDTTGNLIRTLKLADGLSPQLMEEGRTFVYLKRVGTHIKPMVGKLP